MGLQTEISNIEYRAMELDDLDGVLEVEQQCFTAPWTPDMFIVEFSNPNSHRRVLVERDSGRVAAYIIYWTVLDEAHLMSIAVLSEFQKRGLARLLMRKFIEERIKQDTTYFSLEVRVGNQRAIELYEKFGFKGIGLRKGYYHDTGEDALLMEKIIS